MTTGTYAIIGAGPSGLAGARNLSKLNLNWVGFERHSDVGGLWDINNPHSTVYESAHLISSKTTTEFVEFPMADSVADYPSHRELRQYFSDFADQFGLRSGYRFNTEVIRVVRVGASWQVTSVHNGVEATDEFAGVIIANGTLSEPNIPKFAGEFTGELIHTSDYRSASLFAGKRVLIVGAGNSGCDIAVDAVHHATAVDISVRRGYYFVPKYLFGKPADTLNQGKPLPARIKQAIDSRILKLFTGDPVKFGFPKPDYKIYESHPVVNSLILHHLGHGDLAVRADIDRFDGATVHFVDGSSADYDLVVLATGYRLHYPFIDASLLNWTEWSPELYLNIFSPTAPNLFVLGMVEASGLGWQGRYEQAELVANFIAAEAAGQASADEFSRRIAGPAPDMSGGYRYLGLERMSYYVNKDAYRSAVRAAIAELVQS